MMNLVVPSDFLGLHPRSRGALALSRAAVLAPFLRDPSFRLCPVGARSLAALLAERGAAPTEVAAELVRQLAAGVCEVHARADLFGRPLVHGGVAAETIFVDSVGQVIVTAPALVSARRGGAQLTDDVRALAALLVELASGHLIARSTPEDRRSTARAVELRLGAMRPLPAELDAIVRLGAVSSPGTLSLDELVRVIAPRAGGLDAVRAYIA